MGHFYGTEKLSLLFKTIWERIFFLPKGAKGIKLERKLICYMYSKELNVN